MPVSYGAFPLLLCTGSAYVLAWCLSDLQGTARLPAIVGGIATYTLLYLIHSGIGGRMLGKGMPHCCNCAHSPPTPNARQQHRNGRGERS